MNTLAHLAITYFCIGVLLATVAGVSKIINEYRAGTLGRLNLKEFMFMVILMVVAWPLLVMDRVI